MNDLEKKVEQIKRANIESQKPCYQEQPRNFKVHIKPDSSIGRGKFKPHPAFPGKYLAHPVTMRALKKDILLAGEDFTEFEDFQRCESCGEVMDRQFWHFCPYCESSWGEASFGMDEEIK